MKGFSRLLALTLLALPLQASASTALDNPMSTHGQVLTEEHKDALTTGVALSFFAGNDRQKILESGVAALMAELVLATPVHFGGKELPFAEVIKASGATIDYSLSDSQATFSLDARALTMPLLLDAFSQALGSPAFDQAHLEIARTSLTKLLARLEHDPKAVGLTTFRSGFYRDSVQAKPFWGTTAEVSVIGLSEVRAFYARAYKQSGASLALVGRIDEKTPPAARKLLDTLSPGMSVPIQLSGWRALPPNSSIIGSADIALPVFVLGYKAPSLLSPDFAPMYLLATLFQTSLESDATTTLPMDTYRPINVTYDFMSIPANLTLLLNSPGDMPLHAAHIVVNLAEVIGTRILDISSLAELKSIAEGHYLTEAIEPQVRARRITLLSSLGLGPGGEQDILRRLEAVTPEDLRRVARQYCVNPVFARVAPRNEVTP